MKKGLYAFLVTAVLLCTGLVVLADEINPSEPQPFSFSCDPTQTPFVEGGYYVPTEGGYCTYTYPTFASSTIVLEVFKGAPGAGVLVKRNSLGAIGQFPFNNDTGPFIYSESPFNFGASEMPQVGDDYFTVIYGLDTIDQFNSAENYFQTGDGGVEAIADNAYIVRWKWGIPLALNAHPASAAYGSSLPTFAYDVSVYPGGGAVAGITGSADCSSDVPLSKPVGSYNINCTQGSLVLPSSEYAFNLFVPETLTITQAPLTVTADAATMTYGSVSLSFSSTLSGFVNGENLGTSGVTGTADCTTNATTLSSVGNYVINCSQGSLSANNYSFSTFVPGQLIIQKAPLTVTADNKSKFPGAAIPPLTSTLSDFVNSDTTTSNDITGTANCTTTATSASPIGTYPITCTQGSLASNNYSFTTYVAGTLTVSPPPPTRCLWALNPAGTDLQFSGSGLIKGNNCVTQFNSSSPSAVSLTGTADIQAVKNCVVGGVVKTGKSSVSPAPLASCQVAPDPFASITKPVASATCTFTNYVHSGSNAVTVNPGTYCGGMKFSGSSNITFAPGIYILKNGPLTVSGSEKLTGTGVSFFLTGTNAGITASGSGTWTFKAPTTGLLKGFVVYLDGASAGIAASSNFSGSSDLYLEGVVYLPKQTLVFSGSGKTSPSSPFASLVADKFVMSGSGTWTLNGSTAQSTVPVPDGIYYTN